MLEGMTQLLPMADVGFVGMVRDEKSLVASTYANRLPADLAGRDTFVLDPMLATGGTLATVIEMMAGRGAASITRDLPARRAGGDRPRGAHLPRRRPRPLSGWSPPLSTRRLNDVGYIVPGLGDAGDRLFGTL